MAVTRKRHLAKATTWRVIATVITVLSTWTITGSWTAGLSIGAIDTVVKFTAYYWHERAWYRTKWGIEDTNQTPP